MKQDSIAYLLFPLVVIVILGAFGFHYIERWSFIDSFYMTITTLTTVGFGEVHPLSNIGKIFTIALILLGVGVATYSFSRIVGLIVEGDIFRTRRKIKMDKQIAKLENHIIICGFGRLGRIVHRDLSLKHQKTVIIDNSEKVTEDLEANQILAIRGSADDEEVLKSAGILKAKVLLTLLPSDAENVYVALCSRDLNPQIKIVARTENEASESRLKRAGVDEIISPYSLSGNKIVERIMKPSVSNYLELAGKKSGHGLVIEEIFVSPDSKIVGQTLEQSGIRSRTGAIIAAIISSRGEMSFNPRGNDVIESSSTMIVLGHGDVLQKFSEVL